MLADALTVVGVLFFAVCLFLCLFMIFVNNGTGAYED